MKSTRLEPGLLTIFRLFLIAQLIMILVNLHVHSARDLLIGDSDTAVVISLVSVAILCGYLTIPWLRTLLGPLYLPAALIASATFSIVALNLFLSAPLSAHAGSGEERAWQSFLYLFVPLVLIAWQYRFRYVVAYCCFTALLDLITAQMAEPNYPAVQDTFHRLLFIRSLSFLLVGYLVARIMQQLRRERQALQEANNRLERFVVTQEQLTTSRERNRMARELHDTLAHTLSGLAVQLEAVRSLWDSEPEHAHSLLQQSLKVTRDGLTETRKAIQSLRATPLEDLGLATAIRSYAEVAAERSGFRLALELPGDLQGLPPGVEQCFYRIAQEAIENISQHAQAKSIRVKLVRTPSELKLEIDDDGVGFDAQAREAASHFGLQGMRERAQLIGANLRVESAPGAGTRLQLCWREDNRQNGDRQ